VTAQAAGGRPSAPLEVGSARACIARPRLLKADPGAEPWKNADFAVV
jgi:hypothetical protein